MQPQKCNAQHAGVQQMQQNRLRQLLTSTVSLLLREEVSFTEIFLHKGKFTGSSAPSGKRSLNCSALVQGPLKPENHQGKVKLLGHSSNCGWDTSGSKIQKVKDSYPVPPFSLRCSRGSSSITSTGVMRAQNFWKLASKNGGHMPGFHF